MTGSQAIAAASPAAARAADKARDKREANARPDAIRFVALAAQLALLQLVMALFHTIEKPHFLQMTAIAFIAFAAHYWIPFRYKEAFWVAVSIGSAFYLLESRTAEVLMASGALIYGIFRMPVGFRWRVSLAAALFGAIAVCYVRRVPHIPPEFYPVFAGLFMFRIFVYAYDVSHNKQAPRAAEFVTYFFILPNYLLALFPVVDFQTMRRGYFQRDIHRIAQQGIQWMMRGVIQLALYRLVSAANDVWLPDRINGPGACAAWMVLTYLLYLNVSGQFHFAIGMLHLFGYDLPETNRKYLLADGPTDLWRRINIYWKDFMVKVVYFPVYFRMRKGGDTRAQVVATGAVFLVTWLFHAYQSFWLRGQISFSWPDTIFWGVLGLMVMFGVFRQATRKRSLPDTSWRGRALHAVQIGAFFCFMSVLWSLWSSQSVGGWIYRVTHWMGAGS